MSPPILLFPKSLLTVSKLNKFLDFYHPETMVSAWSNCLCQVPYELTWASLVTAAKACGSPAQALLLLHYRPKDKAPVHRWGCTGNYQGLLSYNSTDIPNFHSLMTFYQLANLNRCSFSISYYKQAKIK